MDKNKILTMEISALQLIERLSSLFKKTGEPHADILADVIINNLEKSPVGLKQLGLALLGIKVDTKYKVGDKVRVIADSLYTWRWNKTAMESIIVNDTLEATIVKIDLYVDNPYDIRYMSIKESGTDLTIDTCSIKVTDFRIETPVAPRNLSELL
jgi:hypothetical protein